jgi:threonine synthase
VRFLSTRAGDSRASVSFRDAVFGGLAPDGGLYVPVEQPDLGSLFAGFTAETTFLRLAEAVARALLAEELGEAAVGRIVGRAFDFAPRLRPLEEGISLLELFHGPTCAFKDFGASFLASVMEELLQEENRRAVILVATSGDTGSAVARAFFRRRNLDVVILYPSGRVSPLQEQQLTTLGENVVALEVMGSFDDCQRLAKQAFLDRELRSALALSSANSINLGRLLPQSFYYIFGRAQLTADGGRLAVGEQPPASGRHPYTSACPAATSATSPPGSTPGPGVFRSRASSPRPTGTTSCPSTCIPGSSGPARRFRPSRTPWTWATRATSSGCCTCSTAVGRRCKA